MLLTRLKVITSNLCKINHPKSLLNKNIKYETTVKKNMSTNKEPNDQPIPFSKSEAAKWKAKYNREQDSERVWYTPISATASISIFLIYFCVLREENDLDELIYRPLPETLKGIDKVYPWIDFYTKPDYVRFHEENKKKEKPN